MNTSETRLNINENNTLQSEFLCKTMYGAFQIAHTPLAVKQGIIYQLSALKF